MTLVKWAPITRRPSMNIFNDFNRMLNSWPGLSDETDNFNPAWAPRTDVREDNSEYMISMDLPGLEKKNINISVSEDVLSISGERKSEVTSEDSTCLRNEVAYGSFNRSFTLSDNVKSEDIIANFKNGVLTLKITKVEPVKPEVKQIAIK